MKFKIFLIVFFLVHLWFVTPVRAETISPMSNGGSESQEQRQPLKTYYFPILPDGSRQFIKLKPPATRLTVFVQLGNTEIRCGYDVHAYSCTAGKPIEITAEAETPIKKFWVENPHEQEGRLQIDVYEVAQSEETAQNSQEAGEQMLAQ